MEANFDHILLFSTNIDTLCENCDLYKTLRNHRRIQQWTIDHEDVDRVLRVVSDTLKPEDIVKIINQHGFVCSELE